MLDTQHPCRVCLAEGARSIFSAMVINDESCTVASINHIREKLQYVTLLQVDEHDGLPFWICELCIVQLNVAYRFKRLAAESDSKLRQHLNKSTAPPDGAITYDMPAISTAPVDENATLPVKQEPTEESIESDNSNRENINPFAPSANLPKEVRALCGTTSPAMVCVQKDLINPAKDKLYLNTIFKEEVIAIPWESITPPETNSKLANQTESTVNIKKPSKPSRKRKRSETKSRNKKSKHKKQHTLPALKGTAEHAKSNSENDRKRRMQKLLDELRIDMMDEGIRYNLRQLPPLSSNEHTKPNLPMLRRNSVCVSSFPWQ
uniref:ZAD domain-containing protein n=1 Tax=Anopheles farauti TaxID=69004 RepID=A0A182QVF1_9DIPT